MKTGFLTLKVKDFLRGLIVAVGTPLLYLLQELIPGWHVSPFIKASLSATVTYLLKNLFTADVSAAVKTVEKAGGAVIENKTYNLGNN